MLAIPVCARPPAAHGRLLAAEVERAWHEATPQPLRFVGCDVANEVIAYAQDRPRSLPSQSFHGDIADEVYADAYGWPRLPLGGPALSDAQLAQSGMALVFLADETDWVFAAAAKAARDPASRQIDIELARTFLGITGQPQRYVIFIIPPQPPALRFHFGKANYPNRRLQRCKGIFSCVLRFSAGRE